jgi:hypothetical protein
MNKRSRQEAGAVGRKLIQISEVRSQIKNLCDLAA